MTEERRKTFVNMVTLEQATFVLTLVPATGHHYWQREGAVTGLMTESQMVVARWHDPGRYPARSDLLRASVKWTMTAARQATGQDRSDLVRAARKRNREARGKIA